MISPYRLLDFPVVYKAAFGLLAPGMSAALVRMTKDLVSRGGLREPVLDVGCGPDSLLQRVGMDPVGVDISPRYARALRERGLASVCASAELLPFASGSFATVWSLGLLHHLSDDLAQTALAEMLRVAGGGDVVVIDAVLPHSAWSRPLAYAVRRLDRGGHVRTQAKHETLLPRSREYSLVRETCSAIGHEVTICHYQRR